MLRSVLAIVFFAVISAFAQAEDRKTLRVGTEGAYPPFNYIDAAGKLQGFDVDIAQALCDVLERRCEFVVQEWEGLIPALLAGRFDVIVASMSITEERKKVVDFTEKYYNTPARFVALQSSDMTDISPAALAGKTLGAQASTIHAGYLQSEYQDSTVRLYGSQDALLLDLASGRIDAAFVQSTSVLEWLDTTEEGKCCAFVGEPLSDPARFGLGAGIALRKGEDGLREQLNAAITQIRADGTYQKINEKYFPFSVY